MIGNIKYNPNIIDEYQSKRIDLKYYAKHHPDEVERNGDTFTVTPSYNKSVLPILSCEDLSTGTITSAFEQGTHIDNNPDTPDKIIATAIHRKDGVPDSDDTTKAYTITYRDEKVDGKTMIFKTEVCNGQLISQEVADFSKEGWVIPGKNI